MSLATFFHPNENEAIDKLVPPFTCGHPVQRTYANITDPLFLDSYLAYRTGPRHRPDPARPYAVLDVQACDALLEAHRSMSFRLAPLQLMDVVVLFPPDEAKILLDGRSDEMVQPTRELINAVESGAEDWADAVDVILGLARVGCGEAITKAVSADRDHGEVARVIRDWYSIARASGYDDDTCAYLVWSAGEIDRLLVSGASRAAGGGGISGDAQDEDDAVSLVREMIPDASIESIRTALQRTNFDVEAAIGAVLDGTSAAGPSSTGSEDLVKVGKRTARRRAVRDVTTEESFTGERRDEDGGYGWLKTRIDAELARQATIDPDDPRDHAGAYTYLLDAAADDEPAGMYDDDPDDAELEGEDVHDSKSGKKKHGLHDRQMTLSADTAIGSAAGPSSGDAGHAPSSSDDDRSDSGLEVEADPEELADAVPGRNAHQQGPHAQPGVSRPSGPGSVPNPARGRGRGMPRGRGRAHGSQASSGRGRGGRGRGSRKDAALRKQGRAGM